MDYARICFVIMPFGSKEVPFEDGTTQRVDFDAVYDAVFVPAIEAVTLPEGGSLIPRRTDRDFFSGLIPQEMFEYIQFSRFAVADVSGLNPNVFYELGVRHSTRGSGTAVFRQAGAPLPYDISQVKALDYAFASGADIAASHALITQVLDESLRNDRMDSPVHAALRLQQDYDGAIQTLLREAEDAVRLADWGTAARRYRAALTQQPTDPVLRVKLGLMLKRQGRWSEAAEHFAAATVSAPTYAEAYRELGIAQNKCYHKQGASGPDGREALERAVALSPEDADALASLGGVLARAGAFEEAHARYSDAATLVPTASYPLLNALKLEALLSRAFELDAGRRFQLQRVERTLHSQLAADPTYNVPWSLFDRAEIRLYLGDATEFLRLVEEGLLACHHRGEAEAFLQSLHRLRDAGLDLAGLPDGITHIEERLAYLPPEEG
jgi:Tfp pilus assembly protein PilF